MGAFRAGNLIDCKNWLVRAFVPECVAYLPESDQFLTSPQDGERYALGSYRRYSLEDMRSLANEALKGYTLTKEQKDKYGLS